VASRVRRSHAVVRNSLSPEKLKDLAQGDELCALMIILIKFGAKPIVPPVRAAQAGQG